MTVAATPLLTGLPATLPARLGAGHGWERCLVVLLRFSDDDGKEKLLLPHGWLAGAIKPSVSRLAWTTQRGNDHGGGIRGEGISEGHGQILPQKKKYAMQKIILDKCPQCIQYARMSNTEQLANQINAMSHNELVEALHANGIAPSGKYGAANLIASDRAKAIEMLIEKINHTQQ